MEILGTLVDICVLVTWKTCGTQGLPSHLGLLNYSDFRGLVTQHETWVRTRTYIVVQSKVLIKKLTAAFDAP